ncbi:MAG: hypothetical protein K8S55_10490 [Phycisphaerae bacterium]|nr:hypothetical protein [Phycisphaerae bacterium]
MIYLAFGMWFILILLTGMGLYRLWTKFLGGALVDWLMLPASMASEMAYSLGRLITGRPAYGGLISPKNAAADPCRNAISGKHGFLVSILASSLTMLVGMTAVLLLAKFLGDDVISSMVTNEWLTNLGFTSLPQEFPTSWDMLWDQVQYQLVLLRGITQAWADRDWLTWQVPVFVYGSAIFAVRLGPVRHDQRAMLAVAVIAVGLVAAAGSLFPPVADALTGDFWHILTYTWATLLFLLVITLMIMAVAGILKLFTKASSSQTASE